MFLDQKVPEKAIPAVGILKTHTHTNWFKSKAYPLHTYLTSGNKHLKI